MTLLKLQKLFFLNTQNLENAAIRSWLGLVRTAVIRRSFGRWPADGLLLPEAVAPPPWGSSSVLPVLSPQAHGSVTGQPQLGRPVSTSLSLEQGSVLYQAQSRDSFRFQSQASLIKEAQWESRSQKQWKEGLVSVSLGQGLSQSWPGWSQVAYVRCRSDRRAGRRGRRREGIQALLKWNRGNRKLNK